MLSGDLSQATSGRLGLRPKFIAIFALMTAVVIAIIVAFVQWRVRVTVRDQTVRQGEAIADTVKATAGYYVLFGLTDDLKTIIADLKKKNPAIEYADFTSAEGKPLATSAPTPPTKIGTANAQVKTDDGHLLHLFVVPFADGTVTKGYFRLLINESQANEAAATLLRADILVALLAILLAVAFAYVA